MIFKLFHCFRKLSEIPTMPITEFSYQLCDGTPVKIRTVRKTDKDLLKHGFGLLSEHARYLRFCDNIPSLSEKDWDYLTDVDQINHVAWGVFDLTSDQSFGIGIGRYIHSDESGTAELAITILDAYQKRGLGTLLLALLYLIAQNNGLKKFCMYLHAENITLLRKLFPLGMKTIFSDGLFHAEVPVLRNLEELGYSSVDPLVSETFKGIR